MIVGVGTDVVEIARVASALDRWGERFVSRILTPEERIRYAHTRRKASHLAHAPTSPPPSSTPH